MIREEAEEQGVRFYSRGVEGAPCDCGGYGDLVEMTPDEERRYGCSAGCCGAAFVCRICGNRWAGYTEAPEME